MLLASDVSLQLHAGSIPILEGALECVRAGYVPGGLNNNREFAECLVRYDEGIPDDLRTLLYDPQTAGGLLISTPDGNALMKAMREADILAFQIGEVLPESKPRIQVNR
jgi:selenide,water dikinase